MPPLALDISEPLPFFRRNQQRSQTFKTVGGHAPLRRQFTQRLLDPRGQQTGLPNDFFKKQSAGMRQRFQHLLRVGQQFRRPLRGGQFTPIHEVFAREEGYRA